MKPCKSISYFIVIAAFKIVQIVRDNCFDFRMKKQILREKRTTTLLKTPEGVETRARPIPIL